MMPAENARAGILLLMAGSFVFTCSDAIAKLAAETVPVVELGAIRYAVFALLVAPVVAWRGGGLRSRVPMLQLARGFGVVLSALCFVGALALMPLPEATAINFAAPLFITVLSVAMLGERVGAARWVATLVGIVGVGVAMQPGTDAFRWAALLPLGAALSWAFAMIATRRIRGRDSAGTTLAWTAVVGLAVMLLLLPFSANAITWRELGLGVAVGIASSLGQLLALLAYRRAPASLLAPFGYLQLIWATLLGAVVFGDRPGTATIIGAAVIAVSGLYSARRERALARAAT